MEIYVRSGDSLWAYSQLFDVPLRLILDSNPGVEPTKLSVGQTIRIPGYVTSDYRIKSGDTYWKIALEKDIPVDMLFLVNPKVNPNQLQVGQIIQMPVRVTWSIVEGKKYYDYETMINDLNRLLDVYPFMRKRTIGASVMGKEIPELRIGKGSKRIHVNGSFHAQEWITTPVLMTFLDEYLRSLTNREAIRGRQTAPLYAETMLSLVPMVNPDGVNLVIHGAESAGRYREHVLALNDGREDFSNWKANIRGVDLNNQFPALWEEEAQTKPTAPAPADYPGEVPLTEPEAMAMAELTREGDFARVLAFHTQGEVIYWGYQGLEPPESRIIVEEFHRVSGYEPVRYIESYAGYKDWFIQDWRRPGFTVELGMGMNPLPLAQFDEIYEESLGILLAGLYM